MTTVFKTFFHNERPSIPLFQQLFAQIKSPEERNHLLMDICGLSLSGWDCLAKKQQHFLFVFLKKERQLFLDYLHNHTVLKYFLYQVRDPVLFKKMLYYVEYPVNNRERSFLKLAFSLQLGFSFPVKLKTLTNDLRTTRVDTDDLLELFAKIPVNDRLA